MYTYQAWVSHVVDGDTLDLVVDLGFCARLKMRVRLLGIDAPEMHGVRHNSEEYAAGLRALDYVQGWMEDHAGETRDTRATVTIESVDGKAFGQGKFGRWLVHVQASGRDLAKDMIAAGVASPRTY